MNSKSARVLLLLVVPGQLVFLYTISLLQGQEAPVSVAFTVCYLCAALLQVNRTHADTHTPTRAKENHRNHRELVTMDAQGVSRLLLITWPAWLLA